MIFRHLCTTILLLVFTNTLLAQQTLPATEIRAVWFTTNWALDWPVLNTDIQSQKRDMLHKLDQLKELNFNMVMFQVRFQGTTMYKSEIEPMSRYIAKSDDFDPLAFAIEQCHKRGMECHAWLLAYPMDKVQFVGKGKRQQPILNKPDYYKMVDDRWHLDPGRPETRKLIIDLTKEIVTNYDIDGIHYDYIRYPNANGKFPDEDSFRKYGQGNSLDQWRRNNINTLVFEVYDEVKALKNWVQVSSSPLGKYRELPEINGSRGWTAYETVFQDAGHWMRSGKHDLLFPMMYHREQYFYPFLKDWIANSNGRYIVPGLGIYQMNPLEMNTKITSIVPQMRYARDIAGIGQAYFRAGNVFENQKGITDTLRAFYTLPAKLPPLTWLSNAIPKSPQNIQIYRDHPNRMHVQWEAPSPNERYTYTIYVSDNAKFDIDNPNNFVAIHLHTNTYSFDGPKTGEYGLYYTVTATDRYHNESNYCLPAYFVFSEEER